MSESYEKRHGTYHVDGHNMCWLWWTGLGSLHKFTCIRRSMVAWPCTVHDDQSQYLRLQHRSSARTIKS
jgi:hypothetical protein